MYEWEKKISEILIQARQEAREEGRKEGIEGVIAIIKNAPIQITHGVKDPIHTTVGPLAELLEEAERLKEEG